MEKNLVFRVASETEKSRLVKKIISKYGYWLGGFYTQEMRSDASREGFKLITLSGGSGVMAAKDLMSPVVYNKYGIDMAVLDGLAVESLKAGEKDGKILLIDELGPITLASAKLAEKALAVLASDCPCIAIFRKGAASFETAFSKMERTSVQDLKTSSVATLEEYAEKWIEHWINNRQFIQLENER